MTAGRSAPPVWTQIGFGLWAPWWVVVSPGRGFAELRTSPSLPGVMLGIAIATGIAGACSAPILIDVLQNTPELAASKRLAGAVVLVQTALVGPLGAMVFLLGTGVVVWMMCAVAGFATDFPLAAAVAVTSGVTGVLHKAFVAGVLYLRLTFRPDRLADNVPSGIDAFIDLEAGPMWVAAAADHLGIFDVWYAVLLAIGLERCLRLPQRRAWTCAAVSFGLVTLARVAATLVVS